MKCTLVNHHHSRSMQFCWCEIRNILALVHSNFSTVHCLSECTIISFCCHVKISQQNHDCVCRTSSLLQSKDYNRWICDCRKPGVVFLLLLFVSWTEYKQAMCFKLVCKRVSISPGNNKTWQHQDCTPQSQDNSACHQLVHIYTPWRWTCQLFTICRGTFFLDLCHRGPLLDNHIHTLYIIMTFGRMGTR